MALVVCVECNNPIDKSNDNNLCNGCKEDKKQEESE